MQIKLFKKEIIEACEKYASSNASYPMVAILNEKETTISNDEEFVFDLINSKDITNNNK